MVFSLEKRAYILPSYLKHPVVAFCWFQILCADRLYNPPEEDM
uniref:Uncharacterized protein n=1 Tax=Rhizophora mucronata TaxID=61149 RepID=A0A2P2PA87_RHIMU